MPNLEAIQEAVLSELVSAMAPVKVVEQAVPDTQTVKRNPRGDIDPYFAIQFGDMQEGYRHNMAGPLYDDYYLPIYVQSIAPTARLAREGYNQVIDALLGETYSWTGNIRKRPGGGMWPLVNSNNATEAYAFPASFRLLIQYA